MLDHLIGEPQRQIGHGANVDGDNPELSCAVELKGAAEQAEAGIVDEVLDLYPCGGQGCGNLAGGIGLRESARNYNRRSAAAGCDLACQRRQAIRATRHQSYAMTIRCENAGQFGAYPRRGTGNQRHTFSHDSMLLNKFHDMWLTLATSAYAGDGMQTTRKPEACSNTMLRS